MRELPARKGMRLDGFDYCRNGAYFVTICVKNGHEMLGKIVGRGDLDAPYVELSRYGMIARKYIENIEPHYDGVTIEKYVIMTNHIHMIVMVKRVNPIGNADTGASNDGDSSKEAGASRSPRPTNALIPNIVRAFKKLTDREFGFNMWQTSYHDRIIRDESEYQKIRQYIDENPTRWTQDKYYRQGESAKWDS